MASYAVLSYGDESNRTVFKSDSFALLTPNNHLSQGTVQQQQQEEEEHLDPLDTNGSHENFSTTSTQVGDSPKTSLSSSPVALKSSTSFLNHRKNFLHTESLPYQSILKGIYSGPTQTNVHPSIATAPLAVPAISKAIVDDLEQFRRMSMSSSQRLNAAITDLNIRSKTPSTARFASLQSPCFFHSRFDDAINVDRVLEEIAAEKDGFSHHRLMETATSVREISKQLQRRPIKAAVRNVMIVTKARDNSLVVLTRELAEWLINTPRYNSDVGVNVYVDAKLRTSKRFNAASLVGQNPKFERMLRYWTPDTCWTSPEKFDLVLTLGGDGTVLFTSYLFQRIVPPILSFSLGSLGFLTNFEFQNYKQALDNVMGEAGMRVNLRMRFTCTVYRAQYSKDAAGKTVTELVEGEQFEVLNELVIDRGPSPYVSNLELYGDNELLTVVQADGCIFSTPTGSTAYSLSAGGPLTHPSIPGILLTPICPHTLSFRPMVLSDSLLLEVRIPKNSRSTAYAAFDGKGRVELKRGDRVRVEAGRFPFPTVVGKGGTGGEWFESVRRALRWNTRGAVQKGFSAKTTAVKAPEDDYAPPVPQGEDEDEMPVNEEDEEWDINPDPINIPCSSVDSGIGESEHSSSCASPVKMSI
ncbi:MAG: NAD(+) kinase [Icmadophila ericetorum]|nr:NAD(+) kinase [Icmadophila ericetorum]